MDMQKLADMQKIKVPKIVSVYSPRGTDWTAYVSAGMARELSRRNRVLLVSCSDDAAPSQYSNDLFEDLGFDEKSNLEIKTCRRDEYAPHALQTTFGEGLGCDFVIFDAPHALYLLPTLRIISNKFVFVIRDYAVSFNQTMQSLEYLRKDRKDVHIIVADCVDTEFTRETLTKSPFSDYAVSSSIIPICRELENEGCEKVLSDKRVKTAVQIACEHLFGFKYSDLT